MLRVSRPSVLRAASHESRRFDAAEVHVEGGKTRGVLGIEIGAAALRRHQEDVSADARNREFFPLR